MKIDFYITQCIIMLNSLVPDIEAKNLAEYKKPLNFLGIMERAATVKLHRIKRNEGSQSSCFRIQENH